MKLLKKIGEKLSFFKKIKKSTWVSIATNLVIIACIFSVFNMCFNVDAKFVSSTGYSAIYRGNQDKKNATLMINIYWGTEYIEPMLEVLKEKNVKTTFFVGGYWVAQNEELLKKNSERRSRNSQPRLLPQRPRRIRVRTQQRRNINESQDCKIKLWSRYELVCAT